MNLSSRYGVLCIAGLLAGAPALAADPPPSTAEVLGTLHRSNLKEIQMGELAQERGQSKDVKAFGKMLVKDHEAADKRVAKLAKQENIDLVANMRAASHDEMPTDTTFDATFAKDMLEDHNKDVAEVKDARDSTSDAKLKSLLGDILPVLQRHQATAQKLVDKNNKS